MPFFAMFCLFIGLSRSQGVVGAENTAGQTLRDGPLEKMVKYCTCKCCEGHTSPTDWKGCTLPLPIGWVPCLPGIYVENNCSICHPSTTTPPSHSCLPVQNITGQWLQIQSSSSDQSVEFQKGVTRSYTVSDTRTWGTTVSANAGVSFGFSGVGITAGVSGSLSQSIAKGYTSEFEMSSTETHTFNYGPGVVWQFQFTVTDRCGSSTIKGNDLALTKGAIDPPCCLPGYSRNISVPHGDCAAGPNVCSTQTSVTLV